MALTTETRHLDAIAAEAQTQAAIRYVWTDKDDENRRLYKKTDSLLRGNIAAEIKAMLDVVGNRTIVFSPHIRMAVEQRLTASTVLTDSR